MVLKCAFPDRALFKYEAWGIASAIGPRLISERPLPVPDQANLYPFHRPAPYLL
ncbi:uncharacterized protein METZ01_LOCUS368920, partial [marine metagenome]